MHVVESATDSSERPRYVCLKLSQEQFDTVQSLFGHYDWDWDKALEDGTSHFELDPAMALDPAPHAPLFYIPHCEGSDECVYCLCGTRITDDSNRQFWWEDGPQPPVIENSRKKGSLVLIGK